VVAAVGRSSCALDSVEDLADRSGDLEIVAPVRIV
jgi:hypothetical protein